MLVIGYVLHACTDDPKQGQFELPIMAMPFQVVQRLCMCCYSKLPTALGVY